MADFVIKWCFMFYRTALQYLKQWINKQKRKPLILRGARQVGKTTLVELCAHDFDQAIFLNLEKSEHLALFTTPLSFEQRLKSIFFHFNLSRDNSKKTLVFIDEIQYSKHAIESIRLFYEEAPDLYVIAAGSLLETLLETEVSFPVGRVEYLFLQPVTFPEFLLAMQETNALDAFNTVPIPNYAIEKLQTLFHEYVLLGGMPEIIEHYVQHKDLVALRPLYSDLLTAYSDDVEKYAKNETQMNTIRHIIHTAPLEAGRRIKFEGFGQSQFKSGAMSSAFRMLEKAMLLSLIYPTTETSPPLLPNLRKSPKLIFLDVGLVNYLANLQSYYFNLNDLNSLYKGQVIEQIVGQTLLALNLREQPSTKFWVREKKQSSAEIDFIIPHKQLLIPIEIKSGPTGRLRSLHQFIDISKQPLAIRLYAGPLQIDNLKTTSGTSFKLLNLPYCLTHKLYEYIEWFSNPHAGSSTERQSPTTKSL